MDFATGEMLKIYERCVEFAGNFYYIPYGPPTLMVEDCPSAIFPSIENASQTMFEEYGIVVNRQWAINVIDHN